MIEGHVLTTKTFCCCITKHASYFKNEFIGTETPRLPGCFGELVDT